MSLLDSIHKLYINQSYLEDEGLATRAKLTLNTFLTVVFFAFSYSLISIVIEFKVGLYSTLILGLAYLFVPFILRKPNTLNFLAHFFLLTSSISSCVLIYNSGGLLSAVTPWLAITPVVALLLAGRKTAWFWTVVMVVVVYAFAIPSYLGTAFEPQFNTAWAIPFDAMALSGFVLVVFLCNLIFEGEKNEAVKIVQESNKVLQKQQSQIKQQNQELQLKQKEIATQNEELFQQQEEIIAQRDALQSAYQEIQRKNEDIVASITYARRIQKALLPSKEEIDAIFPQNFVLFRPRDIVSGDFYWCTEKYGRKFIAAADCTGHGIPGAFMSMIGVEMLNEIVVSKDIIEADKILNKLNLSIGKALRQDEGENKDGMDIALCIFHYQTQELEYAGAMNPIIYIQNNNLTEVKATKKGVGGHQVQNTDFQGYQKQIISVQAPTMLYLFSDGFQDQFGGKDGRKFMIKNLRQLFLEIHSKPVQEQRQILKDTITNWMGERHKQIDDILVIGVKL
jgi:serine phosphatase RsbU (regulator of sigma subunit)